MWTCPLCNAQLSQQGKTWRCEQNHSFDQAKEGYLNLLPVQKKRSKDPGDNAEMVIKRREFLALGHYQPFVEAINSQLTDTSGIDLGCGEGFYTSQFKGNWQGCDISKEAVKRAAKRYKNCHFAVASTAALPIPDQSVAQAVGVFAPVFVDEVLRVLKPEGIFVLAGPGPEHLASLKEKIYPTAEPSTPVPIDDDRLALIDSTIVTSSFSLSSSTDIEALISMTPMHYHGDQQAKADVIKSAHLDTSAQFLIRTFKRVA